ncbi:MAG: LacI family transcriptional regulator [Chloroflexota bacterium]|nr:LacI family transcriptional regulator [Chloroflexota bacterium]
MARPKAVRATLSDVALTAGTSIPTVSKVLRGGTDVSRSTRERVMKAVALTGYQRSTSSRDQPGEGAADSRAGLIDLILVDLHGSWAIRALSGVEQAAARLGLGVIVTMARPDDDWLTILLRRKSEGAIVHVFQQSWEGLRTLQAAGVPVVLMDPMSDPPDDIPSVSAASWNGGRLAAEHLLDLGHIGIAAIGGMRRDLYSEARLDGFRSAMVRRGVEVDQSRFVYGRWSRDEAARLSYEMLTGPNPPTAFFACNEAMAFGVYDSVARLGLRVPQDISVVGFDDLPEALWVNPPLTTVQQPIAEMGAAAVRMLVELRAEPSGAPNRPARHEEHATSLVERSSTAPPPITG